MPPVSVDNVVMLRGLRLGRENGLSWPWDEGVTLGYSQRDEVAAGAGPAPGAVPKLRRGNEHTTSDTKIARFDSGRLIPPSCDSLGVVEDRGMTVAIAVRCRAPL